MALEQRYVDRVYTRFERLRAEMSQLEAEGHGRASLGHEGGLYERDVLVLQAARRVHQLDSAHEGLVFGRLDLDSREARYIGRLGLRDENLEPLTIDWRAPAAAPFYQATVRARQSVVRRRMIDCRRQRVVGIEDDLLAPDLVPPQLRIVGDGALLAALNRSRDGEMRDIIATIQREQDEAIRAPADGATMITGGPGTGKTAVALHRAAYLLYQQRRRFERGGILVVGPSTAFLRFIERVLPSLGESSAVMRSLGNFAGGVQTDRHDDRHTAALKGSLRIRDLLAKAVRLEPADGPQRLRLTVRGVVLELDAKALMSVRRGLLARTRRYHVVRPNVERALLAALWKRYCVGEDEPDLSVEQFRSIVTDRDEFTDFVRAWWPVVSAWDVLRSLSDVDRLRQCVRRSLWSEDDLRALAHSWQARHPSVEDVALIDELNTMLGRPDPEHFGDYGGDADRPRLVVAPADDERRYAHIVVDEAQDLSAMQWRMIARRGPRASWTIVGDPLQSVRAGDGEAEQALRLAVGKGRQAEYRLGVNYRNPREIFAVAERVVRRREPAAVLPRAVRRTRARPKNVSTPAERLPEEVIGQYKALARKVDGAVAVICPGSYRERVAAWLPVESRRRIFDAYESKGLEFDGVLVVEPTVIAAESPMGDRALYIAFSRATAALTTVASDDWSP